jgi:hypothetical protein
LPYVRRQARKRRTDAIVLKPIAPGPTPKASDRDVWEDPIAAAEDARSALTECWRIRRDSS